MKLQTVHVRVTDAATGKPTPCRVRFATAEGVYFPPLGRLAEFPTERHVAVGGNVVVDGKKYAYIDGACEVPLPSDTLLQIEIHKGPEYLPILREEKLPPGKLALRYELQRIVNLRSDGWYSGDVEAYAPDPFAALLEAGGEDVAVVNLLAHDYPVSTENGECYWTIPNLLAFSGQKPAIANVDHLVAVNSCNRNQLLGELILLHCHRPVFPLSHPEGPANSLGWCLRDWCDQCHRKNGLVVVGHWVSGRTDETLAETILGNVDAWMVYGRVPPPDEPLHDFSGWYAILNAGLRVPLAAGSGKDCNVDALGSHRTFALLGAGRKLVFSDWIEAVRAGRTFVTHGPLLTFTVNGEPPGSEIEVAEEEAVLRVQARAWSLAAFERLEILTNGQVVAHAAPRGVPATTELETELTLRHGGWLAARARSRLPNDSADYCVAHTSPVYVRIANRLPWFDPEAISPLLLHLDQMLAWVEKEAPVESEEFRAKLAGIFSEAQQKLLAKLGKN